MHIAVQAVDRATGRILASLSEVDVPDSVEASPYDLAKRVRNRFTRAGLLSAAQAACALFVSRPMRSAERGRRRV